MQNQKIIRLSIIALFAAIICISNFLKIPFGPIPLVLQNGICVLTGILIGGLYASVPCVLWLVAGLLGLPVYSGGSGGLAVWFGPTGGFLPGYFFGAFVAGLIAGKPLLTEKKVKTIFVIRVFFAFLVGMLIIYVPGVIWFIKWTNEFKANDFTQIQLNKNFIINEFVPMFKTALNVCVFPFLIGDAIKIAILLPIPIKVRPIVAQYLN